MVKLQAETPWAGIQAFDHGDQVSLRALRTQGLASIAVQSGQLAALQEAAKLRYGIELPSKPQFLEANGVRFIATGPGRWLAQTPRPEATIAAQFGAHAAITDQSDGRALIAIRGPKARETLAKLIAVDLHPRAFGPGDTASSLAAHTAVQFWQIDPAPAYEIAVFRSLGLDLLQALCDAAAPFGARLEIESELS